ncbi:MAG TPA: hypothetical protein VM510_17400 [Caulifigura sp.]|nr:hypothetical protein [Caulifigura sp.]
MKPAESQPAETPDELARKRKLRLAILTGGLIAVTGMAMVGLTILGGSATRRGLRRKPLQEPLPAPEPIPADRFDDVEMQDPAQAPDPPQESSGERAS